MKLLLVLFLLVPVTLLHAQKKEGFFNSSFKPSEGSGRFYAVIEKKGDRWHREAFYIPERGMATSGWYKDEECNIPDGEVIWYHPNKELQSKQHFKDGKEDGLSLRFHENGMMRDSCYYTNGKPSGARLGWNEEGYLIDSTHYDGMGNSVHVNWYPGGQLSSTGRMTNDTVKVGKWKHYRSNGNVLAIEEYDQLGKRTVCNCYDEKEIALDTALCAREEEASYPGEEVAWRRFLERNLQADVPVRNKAPEGMYTVVILFVVNTDGTLSDFRTRTNHGYGMEEEVLRILKRSPKWVPAFQFGRHVKAYRLQPVTFVVMKD
jgi:antitoxin component YwqK of YwqJK toxin-antitoxin module